MEMLRAACTYLSGGGGTYNRLKAHEELLLSTFYVKKETNVIHLLDLPHTGREQILSVRLKFTGIWQRKNKVSKYLKNIPTRGGKKNQPLK